MDKVRLMATTLSPTPFCRETPSWSTENGSADVSTVLLPEPADQKHEFDCERRGCSSSASLYTVTQLTVELPALGEGIAKVDGLSIDKHRQRVLTVFRGHLHLDPSGGVRAQRQSFLY